MYNKKKFILTIAENRKGAGRGSFQNSIKTINLYPRKKLHISAKVLHFLRVYRLVCEACPWIPSGAWASVKNP